MDFGLTEEQLLLAETVRRYLSDNCPTSRVRSVMEGEDGHDEELWRGLNDLGVGAILLPQELDGLGGEFLDLALVAEQLGYHAAPGPFLGCSMAMVALLYADDAGLGTRWLPALAGGDAIGTVALSEAGGRWEPEELEVRVEGGRLSGTKPLVPYSALADFFVVAARDGRGPGLWLVEAEAGCVHNTALAGNDMTRRLGTVDFERAPALRLGGRDLIEKTRDAGLVLIAVDSYGGARRCLAMARDYALEREQFGQVIGAFQAVKHQLADLATELEPALSLCWYAAHAFDALPAQAPRQAAIAKARLTDLYDRAVRDSMELHGGISFTWEFDLQLWFRRSMFNRSFLGDSCYQRQRVADLAGW
ncbi:MAG: acyl-CoA dehydrogenase family protein [Candidatus Binatia bacterium]